MEFKGFDDWIEIFRGGTQTDSKGRTHDGNALIDKAVSGFDSKYHEPPIVVGHPKDNAPAFGWVDGLKKAVEKGTNVLLARFKQVVPEFEDMAKKGLYKKRSASFYPDGRLRHVGFLGAAPPAVKGLADLSFSDDEGAVSFEFYDPGMNAIARIFRSLRDWIIEKEGKDAADAIIPDWDVEYMREEANRDEGTTDDGREAPGFASAQNFNKEVRNMTFKDFMEAFKFWKQVEENPDLALPPAQPASGPTQFTDADIEHFKNEAAVAERKKVEAEFAEKDRTAKREARKQEISGWCEGHVREGKIAPAWVKSGIADFMQALDAEAEISFTDETKATSLDWFKHFIDGLPKLIDFNEIAARDKDAGGAGSAGEKLDGLTRKKMEKDKDLGYSAAFSEVQQEHPGLAVEYAAEITQSA